MSACLKKTNICAVIFTCSYLFSGDFSVCDPLLESNPHSFRDNGTFTENSDHIVDDLLSTSSLRLIKGILPKPINGSYSLQSKPHNGTLEFDQVRTYKYVRNEGFFGDDTFSFSLTNTTSKATVKILIKEDTRVPSYKYFNIDISGDEDTAIVGDFKIPEIHCSLPLSIENIVVPKYGSLNFNANKWSFAYFPNCMNFSGKGLPRPNPPFFRRSID